MNWQLWLVFGGILDEYSTKLIAITIWISAYVYSYLMLIGEKKTVTRRSTREQ